MIPALTCLLLPFAGQCPQYVRYAARVSDVAAHRTKYNGENVSVTGRVQRLDQWTSRTGVAEELFAICDDGCIRVYMQTHSPIRNGQLVTVRGTYYETFHAGRKTYYNELESTEVLPRE